VSDDTLEARFPLQKAGLYLGAVQAGAAVLPLAPLSLPYSPEFEPRIDPLDGRKTLAELARISGGAERTTWDDVFSASRLRHREVQDLVWPLTLGLLLLHVSEIAGRRLLLFIAASRYVRSLRVPRLARFRRRPVASDAEPGPAAADDPGRAAPRPEPSQPVVSPLARAKAKARGRLER